MQVVTNQPPRLAGQLGLIPPYYYNIRYRRVMTPLRGLAEGLFSTKGLLWLGAVAALGIGVTMFWPKPRRRR